MSPAADTDNQFPAPVRSRSDSQAVTCALLFIGTSLSGNHVHQTNPIPSCWPGRSHPQTPQELDTECAQHSTESAQHSTESAQHSTESAQSPTIQRYVVCALHKVGFAPWALDDDGGPLTGCHLCSVTLGHQPLGEPYAPIPTQRIP